MRYKLYTYELTDNQNRLIGSDRHYEIFSSSTGADTAGSFAKYRGKNDAVLMYVRRAGKSTSDFIGLIGKHATEREVTKYDSGSDEASSIIVRDDDYPNSPFICMPRLRMIACMDGSRIKADSAIARLHAILLSRQKMLFVASSLKQAYDLRKAIKNFRVFEVDFEIRPVNPHSEDLGLELDEQRKRDHIRKLMGKMKANKGDKLELAGGLLTAIQQLQKSGHAVAGFKAETEDGVQINVPKPGIKEVTKLTDDEEESDADADVRIDFPTLRANFPLSTAHVNQVRTIAKKLSSEDE